MPKYLRSFVVCRFSCPGCNASYSGETTPYLTTKIKQHLEANLRSHIFKHFSTNRNCKELCDAKSFDIIDSTTSPYRLKLKETMHITLEKLSLNKQVKHVSTYYLTLFHLCYYCYCYCDHVTLILFKITSLICYCSL